MYDSCVERELIETLPPAEIKQNFPLLNLILDN